MLAGLNLTDAERQSRVALQTKIQNAVITGNGWEGVPPVMRRQAETSWFRSLLLYDPASAMARTHQPILLALQRQDGRV